MPFMSRGRYHCRQLGNRFAGLAIALMASSAGYCGEAPDLSGAQLFAQFCASCHGATAHGDGPVAATLRPHVPDLTRIAVRRGGAFPAEEVRRIIDGQALQAAHGTREMPVWGWEFYGYRGEDPARRRRVEELLGRLVDYLRSIQRP